MEKTNDTVVKIFYSILISIFIFCSFVIFIREYWIILNTYSHIVVTLGPGIAIFIFALVAAKDVRFEKILMSLFILATLFEMIGLLVAFMEISQQVLFSHHILLGTFGMLWIQLLIMFFLLQKTELLFLSIVFALLFYIVLFNLFYIRFRMIAFILGFSLICISYGLGSTKYRVLTPLGYLIGGVAFLYGLFHLLV